MIWREKRVLLIVLGILLAANTIFFFTYRVQYESRLEDLETRLADSESRLQQAQIARATAEKQYAAYRKIERDVQEVYEQQWSTQARRLTAMILEVKRLAVAASLVPKTLAFSQGQAATAATTNATTGATTAYDPRIAKAIGARTVTISFPVEGTYQQARRLINLLELSPQFVIIDAISLTARDEKSLTLTLQVKTLFREGPTPAAPRRPGVIPASSSLVPDNGPGRDS